MTLHSGEVKTYTGIPICNGRRHWKQHCVSDNHWCQNEQFRSSAISWTGSSPLMYLNLAWMLNHSQIRLKSQDFVPWFGLQPWFSYYSEQYFPQTHKSDMILLLHFLLSRVTFWAINVKKDKCQESSALSEKITKGVKNEHTLQSIVIYFLRFLAFHLCARYNISKMTFSWHFHVRALSLNYLHDLNRWNLNEC